MLRRNRRQPRRRPSERALGHRKPRRGVPLERALGQGWRGLVTTACGLSQCSLCRSRRRRRQGRCRSEAWRAADAVVVDVTSELEQQANSNPNQKVGVIVQSASRHRRARCTRSTGWRRRAGATADDQAQARGRRTRSRSRLPRRQDHEQLERLPGLTITPDSRRYGLTSDPLPSDLTTGTYTSNQLWAHETGNSFWPGAAKRSRR